MNKGKYEDKDKQIEVLLNAIAHEIGDPMLEEPGTFTPERDFDPRKVKKAIMKWYGITQSALKLLFELKKEKGKELDPNQKRIINKNLKEFGWSDVKKKEDIIEKNLSDESPYIELSEQFFIHNMVIERGFARGRRETREYYEEQKKYVDSLTEEDKLRWLEAKKKEFELLAYVMDEAICLPDEERIYLDESSDIGKIYASTPQDRTKAMADLNEVKVLKERKEDIYIKHVYTNKYLNEHRETISRELIEDCIALGYTAGLNANTTEILRRNRFGNRKSNRNSSESNSKN